MTTDNFVIHDARSKSWFEIDNKVVDDHFPEIGIPALGLYCVLCRYANDAGQIAYAKIREMFKGYDVFRLLEHLEKANLIRFDPGETISLLEVK